jgi:chromosome segregation ATPase
MSPYNPDIPDIQGQTPITSRSKPVSEPPAQIQSLDEHVASEHPSVSSVASRPVAETSENTTVEVDQELVALRQRQKELENQKNQLEEAERRRTEYHNGRKEMEENLIRGIGILDEELIQARRQLALIEKTLSSFSENLSKVQRLNHESWTTENYATELTRALTTLENARMEWNSARVKLPSLDPLKQNSTSAQGSLKGLSASSLLQSLESASWSRIFKLGLLIHWPILMIALFTLLIFVALLFK